MQRRSTRGSKGEIRANFNSEKVRLDARILFKKKKKTRNVEEKACEWFFFSTFFFGLSFFSVDHVFDVGVMEKCSVMTI